MLGQYQETLMKTITMPHVCKFKESISCSRVQFQSTMSSVHHKHDKEDMKMTGKHQILFKLNNTKYKCILLFPRDADTVYLSFKPGLKVNI